jgi:hypothetical protein
MLVIKTGENLERTVVKAIRVTYISPRETAPTRPGRTVEGETRMEFFAV